MLNGVVVALAHSGGWGRGIGHGGWGGGVGRGFYGGGWGRGYGGWGRGYGGWGRGYYGGGGALAANLIVLNGTPATIAILAGARSYAVIEVLFDHW